MQIKINLFRELKITWQTHQFSKTNISTGIIYLQANRTHNTDQNETWWLEVQSIKVRKEGAKVWLGVELSDGERPPGNMIWPEVSSVL